MRQSMFRCRATMTFKKRFYVGLLLIMSSIVVYTTWSYKSKQFFSRLVQTEESTTCCACMDQTSTGTGIATSGISFSGKSAVRTFPSDKARFSSFKHVDVSFPDEHTKPWCSKWGVVTTIFKVSETIRRFVKLNNWCLVVVFDKKVPLTYDTKWVPGDGGNEAVVLLYPEDQEAMKNTFVSSLPWNSFGRKNVGYLYAITHGADVIWDFDDDNMLKFWISNAAPNDGISIDASIPSQNEEINVLEPTGHNWPTYNPYPILGAPTLPSWPRGLPPDDVKLTQCSNTSISSIKLHSNKIAVLQSLADYQPDVDAMFRITMPVPMWFNRTTETKPLIVPDGVFTPYNAQATLHFRNGFWGLYLPITVTGRVSDIWRSYITKRLLWDVGLKMGFLPRPLVVQDRNVHSNVGDLDAEIDLYLKSKQLIEFLGEWKGKGETLVERIEELWIEMYKRKFIEYNDIKSLQLWLQSLIDSGYKFPPVTDSDPIVPRYPIEKREEKTDTSSEMCEIKIKRMFWTSDVHQGCRVDTPSVLSSLGQSAIVASVNVFNMREQYPFVFDPSNPNYDVKLYTNFSMALKPPNRDSFNSNLTEAMMMENFEFYKTDKQLAETDAFVCSFPASRCELWMPFNKTIIFLPAHRYNLGRCTENEFNRLNDHLITLSRMNSPRHVIGAMSFYDQEYLRHYTGLDPLPLYSSSMVYTESDHIYNSTKKKEILSSYTPKDIKQDSKHQIVEIHALYKHWKFVDLLSHRAIVYVPYSVMSYKLTEFYALSIPLFMPSIVYFQHRCGFGRDRATISKTAYCDANKIKDKEMKPHPSFIHPYSPNLNRDIDNEAENYWLQMSDFYQWPYITYFDNVTDLDDKLEKADFKQIHESMVQENKKRFKSLVNTWCKVLPEIDRGRKVPQDYYEAISMLYNTSRLQYY